MSSLSSPPPSPILRTPCARTSVKPFGQHARRRVKFADALDAIGGETGFLLQLLDRGGFDRRVRILITDEPGRNLDAPAVGRHARLVDQDDLALIFGEDDDRADVASAACIFPFAAPERAYELALPHHFGAEAGRPGS